MREGLSGKLKEMHVGLVRIVAVGMGALVLSGCAGASTGSSAPIPVTDSTVLESPDVAIALEGGTTVVWTALDAAAEVRRVVEPDPPALSSKSAFEIVVEFDRGELRILSAKRVVYDRPFVTPRKMGRFSAELFVGPTLVDRLRFDLPLIFDDSSIGESYAKGLTSHTTLILPDSDRPTRLEIWDRAREKRWVFSYPPHNP